LGNAALVAAAVTAASVVGLAGPATADVTIDSEQGQRTGGARIAFRVTNESSTASITKVEVRFPGNVRIPEIYPIAVADWAPSITMTRVDNNPANDVPSAVVWVTMPGREIKPGATSLLPLAMGPMPDTETVYFDVVQTRSDGSIETWAGVDVPAAGAQHPAFTLKLAPLEPGQVPEDHGHGGAAASGGAQTGAAVDPEAADPDSTDGSGTVQLALVLLLIAVLTGFALFWQRRRGAPRVDQDVDQDVDRNVDEDRAEAADDTAPATRARIQREKGAAPKKRTAVATGAPSPAKAKAKAKVKAKGADEPARVQRRTVVRASVPERAAGRRPVARKSTGGGTVTVARGRGNGSKRAGNVEGDNA
jgi:uncharacterized protein YcnI